MAAFCVLFLYSFCGFASSRCAQLKQELKALQNAQNQIFLSMVNNHETFAATLEEYGVAVENADEPAVKKISGSMNSSANAFRNRGIKAKQTAISLNKMTADLISRVVDCLK